MKFTEFNRTINLILIVIVLFNQSCISYTVTKRLFNRGDVLRHENRFWLIVLIYFLTTSCTWNASIKPIDSDSSISNNEALPECSVESLTDVVCKVSSFGKLITEKFGLVVTSWSNLTASNTVTAVIPDGYYLNQSCSLSETNLISTNIKSGVIIFGVTGSYTTAGSFQTGMASNANRDAGVEVISNLAGQTISTQMTLDAEQNTYAGADLPTTSGYGYRDIPDNTKDDDGLTGITCKYAPRPTVNCGFSQNTISARISDCATQNLSNSVWDGSVQCSRGQGVWKLVTRQGVNKEVWQDQRTGQLWSSILFNINWCQASGNQQKAAVTYSGSDNGSSVIVGNGTIGGISGGSSSVAEQITITFTSATTFSVSGTNCGGGAISSGGLSTSAGSTVTWSRANYCSFTITQGAVNFAVNDRIYLKSISSSFSCVPGAVSGLQPMAPVSSCAEVTGLNEPAGENWLTGVYLPAKGGMGKTVTAQSPSVRWRLPTIDDYYLANINGIRFVLPDMGLSGGNRPTVDASVGGTYEWVSTLISDDRRFAWVFFSSTSEASASLLNNSAAVRCVGR